MHVPGTSGDVLISRLQYAEHQLNEQKSHKYLYLFNNDDNIFLTRKRKTSKLKKLQLSVRRTSNLDQKHMIYTINKLYTNKELKNHFQKAMVKEKNIRYAKTNKNIMYVFYLINASKPTTQRLPRALHIVELKCSAL